MCRSHALESLGKVNGFLFLACKRCEFIFTPEVEYKELVKLYKEGYHGIKDGAPEKGWSHEGLAILNPVFKYTDRKSKLNILDFGTGQSLLPELLRQIGNKVTAVDIVPPLIPHPDRITGDIMDLNLESEIYDVVFSYQVFEHLAEPAMILNELLRLTKSGGYLFIHTDMETPERENGFENWWYVLPPDHCSYYRHKTFEIFALNNPCAVIFKDPTSVLIRKDG